MTTTTMTFEQATEKLGAELMALYDTDENGQAIELVGEKLEAAQQTVDEAQKAATKTFGPLYEQLQIELAEQQEKIEALEALLAQPQAVVNDEEAVVNHDEADEEADEEVPDFPTIEWLIKNHQGKGVKLSGFNVVTIWHNKKFGTAPAKGWWAKQDQKPWIALAVQYSGHLTAKKSIPLAIPAPASFAAQAFALTPQQIQLALSAVGITPELAKSKATCAYQLWVGAWKANPENKGKIFPPAGAWKKLPAAEKAVYEAKFKTLEASRAIRA